MKKLFLVLACVAGFVSCASETKKAEAQIEKYAQEYERVSQECEDLAVFLTDEKWDYITAMALYSSYEAIIEVGTAWGLDVAGFEEKAASTQAVIKDQKVELTAEEAAFAEKYCEKNKIFAAQATVERWLLLQEE